MLGTVGVRRPGQAHGDRRGYCPATVAPRGLVAHQHTAEVCLSTGKRELLPRWPWKSIVDRAHVACDNLANGRRLASDSVCQQIVLISLLLRFSCQCFCVLHSGAADRRGALRRCRSRFQRFAGAHGNGGNNGSGRRGDTMAGAATPQHRFGPARQWQHRFGPAHNAGDTGSAARQWQHQFQASTATPAATLQAMAQASSPRFPAW